MKNSSNFYELRKPRVPQLPRKTNYTNSILYKEINSRLQDSKPKPTPKELSKDHKERRTQEDRQPSKKSSLQLSKKPSRNDLSGLQLGAYQKLTDNYLVDTQEDTRFQLEDTRHLVNQRRRSSKQTLSSEQGKKIERAKVSEQTRVQRNWFSYLYIIGKGGFGKVWKVEHKKTKNQYAMKEMLKSIVMTKKSVQSVMNERVLLSQFHSPFIVNMHFAFQDRDTLYLVLDLMEGGDLRYHIGSRVFTEIQSKFFIACIVLGLEDLESHSIIHRDIKPENLVLDSRGYIRITDLGIARLYKPNNSCDTSGTPGYMSPEVICRMNHSFVSDYFALGVIAYELMTGRRPYNGRSRNEIRDLMLAKQAHLKFNDIPEDWSFQAADFVNKLIQRKPQNRLGCTGISEVKGHPWLSGINWQKLRSKDIDSPFLPMMKKSNFDQDEQITIEDEQEAELIEKNSLLLRKPEFQELFSSYYYAGGEGQGEKKTSKRVVSAYRKSTQQEREGKLYDLQPEKKLSYNDNLNRRKADLQPKLDKPQPLEKKRPALYEKTFFR